MPELPEVQAARNLLEAECVGKAITKVIAADDTKVFVDLTPAQLEFTLLNKVPLAAKRLGKHCWLDFGPATPCLLFHFGMTGGAVVRGGGPLKYQRYSVDGSEWPPAYVKLELHFDDGTEWAFCDTRRFARIRLVSGDPTRAPPLSELGWDPLLSMPPLAEFSAALARKKVAIKALLLDQTFTAGVGNWVADECLYQARIHPEKRASALSAQEAEDLHHQIQEVCRIASSVDADSERYPPAWLFHHRWSKGKSTEASIDGRAIKHVTVGGRTSAYVPSLQKLAGGAGAGAGGAVGAQEEGEEVGEEEEVGAGEEGEEGAWVAGGNGKKKRAAGGEGGGWMNKAARGRKRVKKKEEEAGMGVVEEETPAAPAEVGALEEKRPETKARGKQQPQKQGGDPAPQPRLKKKSNSKPKGPPAKPAQKLRAASGGGGGARGKPSVVRPK